MSISHTKAIIFLNGDRTDLSQVKTYIDKQTLLIGCDGGTDHILALGYKPHVVIGDFDSLSDPTITIKGVTYVHYPADKDFTDSELAIRYAAKLGYREIILAGVLGTRLDHLIGNIYLLIKPEFSKLNIKIIEGNQVIYLIHADIRISGKKGDIISFIPIKRNTQVKSTVGLKYDLAKYQLSPRGNLGISNVFTSNIAEVNIKKGILLVVHHTQ
jgi:thiamine pyrophosphokinase